MSECPFTLADRREWAFYEALRALGCRSWENQPEADKDAYSATHRMTWNSPEGFDVDFEVRITGGGGGAPGESCEVVTKARAIVKDMEVYRLRSALVFYANPENYINPPCDDDADFPIITDGGAMARAALAGQEPGEQRDGEKE